MAASSKPIRWPLKTATKNAIATGKKPSMGQTEVCQNGYHDFFSSGPEAGRLLRKRSQKPRKKICDKNTICRPQSSWYQLHTSLYLL